DVVVARIYRLANAAFDLHSKDERMQEGPAGHSRVFAEREDRGGDGTGGMDDGLEMRIVEVERVRGDTVEHRGMHDVDALASPQDRRLRWSEERSDSLQRAGDRRVTACAHGAPQPVQHGTLRLVINGLGH